MFQTTNQYRSFIQFDGSISGNEGGENAKNVTQNPTEKPRMDPFP